MRKSIAKEYFDLSAALIAASLIVMSTLIIGFSIHTYNKNRIDIINTASADARIKTDLYVNGNIDGDELKNAYELTSSATGVSFILLSPEGEMILYSEDGEFIRNSRLSGSIMREVTFSPDGFYIISSLDGFYTGVRVNMLYPVRDGYVLAASIHSRSFLNYIISVVIFVVVVFAALMIVIVPILRYSVNRILRPVRKMTLAAKRFGEGDFSEKLEIPDNNELGFLAKTLNEMAGSLEATEENRKSFISNVSHELRTPMTTIGGFVDGILDGTIPKERQREYLKTVSEEINRLARLVRSMLNISKYESGEMKLQTEDFDLTELTAKTVLLFEKRIEGKKVDIMGLDADRFYVNADKDLTAQVIFNLTENAVKFVNEGGYISYSFRDENGYIAAVVRNSGAGLKKHEINKVFDRFYKTDESRGIDKTGVGLGLSIVQSIIKLHGGNVIVRSKPGEYTEFEFTVPAGVPYGGRPEPEDQ